MDAKPRAEARELLKQIAEAGLFELKDEMGSIHPRTITADLRAVEFTDLQDSGAHSVRSLYNSRDGSDRWPSGGETQLISYQWLMHRVIYKVRNKTRRSGESRLLRFFCYL